MRASLYSKPASSRRSTIRSLFVHVEFLSVSDARVRWSALSASARMTARNARASDTAPGSGVPRLFSASGRARPILGSRSAVACAACVGDLGCGRRTPRPGRGRRRPRAVSASLTGTSTSTRVLSPTSALPICWMLRSAAATPSADGPGRRVRSSSPIDVADSTRRPSPTARRRCRRRGRPRRPRRRCSTAPAPAPRPALGRGRVDGGARAALHADAVVAVAGDRVDAAELLDVARRWCRGSRSARRGRRAAPHRGRPRRPAARAASTRSGSAVTGSASGCGCLRRRQVALAVGRGVGRGVPEVSSSSSSQNRVSESPAMSKLVTNSPTRVRRRRCPRSVEQLGDPAVDDEQLFVLDGAQPVEDEPDAGAAARRRLGGQVVEEPASPAVRRGRRRWARRFRRCPVRRGCPGRPPSGRRHGEQRLVGAGQGAAGEGHAERAGAVVGVRGDAVHLVQREPGVGSGGGDLEDRQVAGDAAALLDLVGGALEMSSVTASVSAGMPLAFKQLRPLTEVQHVAGVVAVAQQHAAAA